MLLKPTKEKVKHSKDRKIVLLKTANERKIKILLLFAIVETWRKKKKHKIFLSFANILNYQRTLASMAVLSYEIVFILDLEFNLDLDNI